MLPRFIRVTDIDEDGNLTPDNPVSVDSKEDDFQYRLRIGDLLLARTGTVGKAYLCDGSEGNSVFAGYLVRFTPNTELVEPRFLFEYTRSSYFKNWVSKYSHAGVQANINAQEYGTLPIWLPTCLVDQQSFIRNIDYLRSSRAKVQNKIQGCTAIKTWILADLLREDT